MARWHMIQLLMKPGWGMSILVCKFPLFSDSSEFWYTMAWWALFTNRIDNDTSSDRCPSPSWKSQGRTPSARSSLASRQRNEVRHPDAEVDPENLSRNHKAYRTSGPAFCDENGRVLRTSEINDNAAWCIGRSIRQTLNSFLGGYKIPQSYWREVSCLPTIPPRFWLVSVGARGKYRRSAKEKAGHARHGKKMVHHYSDINLLLPCFLSRYTSVMWWPGRGQWVETTCLPAEKGNQIVRIVDKGGW